MAKRERRKNLKMQVNDALQSLCCFGQSKHAAKQAGTASQGIYSFGTYHTYQQQCHRYCEWVKAVHPGTKTLADARQYVDEYIATMIDTGLSPFTIKTATSALAKLYQCKTTDFRDTPARSRANITRSRRAVARDKDFDESLPENARLARFCCACGLRRGELKALKGSWYVERPDGTAYIDLTKTSATKGGRPRIVPILPEDVPFVREVCRAAGEGHVWPALNTHADIHAWRAIYCQRLYDAHKRDVRTLPRSERYHCQLEKAGIVYDVAALKFCSEALGHSRTSIIPSSYLYGQ